MDSNDDEDCKAISPRRDFPVTQDPSNRSVFEAPATEMELQREAQDTSDNLRNFDRLMSRLEKNAAGRHFSRDEMNER